MDAGAVICLGGLIFAGIRLMSGRFQGAIPNIFLQSLVIERQKARSHRYPPLDRWLHLGSDE